MVAIIDDREDVWSFSHNLVHVKPYLFFEGTADINFPPGRAKGAMLPEGTTTNRKYTILRIPKNKTNKKENTKQKTAAQDQKGKDIVDSGQKLEENMETDHSPGDTKDEQETKWDVPQGPDSGDSARANEKTESKLEELSEKSESKTENPQLVDNDKCDMTSGIQETDNSIDKAQQLGDGVNRECEITSGDQSEKGGVEESMEICESEKDKDGEDIDPSDEGKETDGDKKVKMMVMKEGVTDSEEVGDMDKTAKMEVSVTDGEEVKDYADQKDEAKKNVSESEGVVEDGDKAKVKVSMSESEEVVEDGDKAKVKVSMTESEEVVEDGDKKAKVSRSKSEEEEIVEDEYDEVVEWQDDDDYLIYLEDVLTRIHTAFFEFYDQIQKKDDPEQELPNLKKIIPYVRKKVLKGCNIVFSGVIPTNSDPEKSKAYKAALSLGATIQDNFVARDSREDAENVATHVVAARPGTTKVNMAKKNGKVKIVNPNWLWVCADRWEKVDEKLFPLKDDKNLPPARDSPDVTMMTKQKAEKRKWSDKDGDSERLWSKGTKSARMDEEETYKSEGPVRISQERRFSDSYNPMLAFSNEDIQDMDKEVEEIFDESDSEDSEEEMRRIVLGQRKRESSSEEESLSGEFPKGWGIKKKKHSDDAVQGGAEGEEEVLDDDEEIEAEIIDQPHRLFKHSDSSSESDASDKSGESIGSVDEEMAAAVEREFLSF